MCPNKNGEYSWNIGSPLISVSPEVSNVASQRLNFLTCKMGVTKYNQAFPGSSDQTSQIMMYY